MTIGHEAEVTDAVEAIGQRMQEKATDELVGRELHDFVGAVLAIILPGKGDMIGVEGDEAAVGDGDAMRVSPEIGENLGGSTERLFGIHDPVDAAHFCEILVETRRIGEVYEVAEKSQSAGIVGLLQAFEEKAAVKFCERLDGEEEVRPPGNPARPVQLPPRFLGTRWPGSDRG